MKNKYVLALLIACIGLTIFLIFNNKDVYNEGPFNRNFSFENLFSVTVDDQNNLYLIDQSRKRIINVDINGTLKYIISGENRGENSISLFTAMATDTNGSLYVLKTILDSFGYYVISEEIVCFTNQGKLEKSIYRVDYPEGKRPIRNGLLKNLTIKDGFLYFYSVDQGSALLNKLALDGNDIVNVLSILLPSDTFLSNITGLKAGSIVYSTKKGQIYKVDTHGYSVLIYPQSGSEELKKSLPVYLGIDSKNLVFYADIIRGEINRLDPVQGLHEGTLFSNSRLIEHGYNIQPMDIRDIFIKQDGSVIVAVNESIITIKSDGKIDSVLDKAGYTYKNIAFHILVWMLPLGIIVLIFFAGRVLYIDFMKRRTSLMIKQVAVFVPLIVIPMIMISGFMYTSFYNTLREEVFDKLKLLAHYGAQMIEGDRLERITGPELYMNEDYKALREKLLLMSKDKAVFDEEILYSRVYKIEDEQLYIVASNDANEGSYYPYFPQDFEDQYLKVFEGGKIMATVGSDEWGDWMYALGPLYASNGQIVGIYEVGMDMTYFNKYMGFLKNVIGVGTAMITTAIITVFLLMTYYLLLSMRRLRKGVNEMAGGNWNTVVSVNTRDEVADLCEGFNKMSEHIRKYISRITYLSESYFRFVPQQFMKLLGKKSILDVRLGDQIKQEMSVMYSNVRSFYAIADALTPEDSFNLINSYLKRVGPVIRNNGGFIGKYLGAGIMALFPGETKSAVKSAIEMRKELDTYNQHLQKLGRKPIDIGIGIHRGPLMLGIIGEEKRLEGTVISDAVNITSIIERLTTKFGASILITENILKDINNPEQYSYRMLGLVHIEGKEEPIRIYDFYHGDSDTVRKIKNKTKDLFEEGIMLYQDGRFYDARSRFAEVIRQHYQDEAAKIYFFLCEEYFKKGAPEGWSGTLSM